jgi:hypothetical protein
LPHEITVWAEIRPALTCLTRSDYSEEVRLSIRAQARIRRRRRRTLATGLVEKHEGKVQKQNRARERRWADE